MNLMSKNIKCKKHWLIISLIIFGVFAFLSVFLPIYFFTDVVNKVTTRDFLMNESVELVPIDSAPVESANVGLEWWQILAIVLSIVGVVVIILILLLVIKLIEKKYDDVDSDDEVTFFTHD